ncbi:MAG: hypothetical protein V3R16_10105 [Nitrospirales bacterium]
MPEITARLSTALADRYAIEHELEPPCSMVRPERTPLLQRRRDEGTGV